jgi:hypothetical protein
MRIQKENSCFNNLRWRIFLEQPRTVTQFIEGLSQIGYKEKQHALFPKIVEMVHIDNGHHLIFVAATNRLQLKLDIDSPEGDRPLQAKTYAEKIVLQLADANG